MKKFSHVTFVVKDLAKTLKSYETLLGLVPGSKGFVQEYPTVKIGILPFDGVRIEFLQPTTDADDIFNRFLHDHGDGIFSYCFMIDNYDEEIQKLKEQGIELLEATQDWLFPGYPFRLAWIPPEAGLGIRVELAEYDALPPAEQNWGDEAI
jgi:catechol 2,3-dioxygenase-like lactoylglutathione lyase family enzyme